MTLSWQHVLIQLAFSPWLVWSHEYYHLKSMKTFKVPETLREDSYFGYSVTYDTENKRLIASAPRADQTGRIYTCDIDQKTNCTTVQIPDSRRDYPDYDHDYWLGATVAGGPSFFVTCAPRHVGPSPAYNDLGAFATCYKSAKNNTMTTIPTIKHKAKEPFNATEKEMDSFGWSIVVSEQNSILIGGPAMHMGRVMCYKNEFSSPVPIKTSNTYNFGYSVAFGKFKKRSVSYIVGSPYGTHGEGSVKIYDKLSNDGNLWMLINSIDNMVGTMYGAVLCTAQIRSNIDTLLIGAPAFAQNKDYNVGAVYVHSPILRGLKLKRIIKGFKSGSFFGSAIISTGDLNGDSYDEIAIGAPYEDDGMGAVYLYCGAQIQSDVVDITWLQKIQPKELITPLSTFGLSLSALRDYDENGCKELAIGAPGVDRVAVLHCMAAVTVGLRAEFPNLQERRKGNIHPFTRSETYANFKSCLDVTYPDKPEMVQALIKITIEMTHTSAELEKGKNGQLSYNVSLQTKQKEYCEFIGLNLPKGGNYNMKIQYKISATLLNNPLDRTNFEGSRVILTDRSKLSITGSEWAAECERGDACEPKLSLALLYGNSNVYKYTIGSTDRESISMTIKNEGEPAYSSCVILRTEGVPIRSLPATNCVRVTGETDVVKCEPQMALKTGGEWNTQNIELDTKHLTNLNKEFIIHTELYDYCGTNKSAKQYATKFELVTESSGIVVTGATQNYVEDVVNTTRLELIEAKQIDHKYTFRNNGPTNWEQVQCEVTLKKSPYIEFTNNTVYVKDGSCAAATDDAEYWRAKCTINKIYKNYENDLHIFINLVNSDELLGVLQKGNVTLESNVNLALDSKVINESIASTLTLREPHVPIWVIICAIIVGLLILLLIAMILRELGFLKRKNQKKLENLRKSVRRQTIRRSMMNEDRRRIISQATEVTADDSTCETNITNRPGVRRIELDEITEELRVKQSTQD